MQWDITDTVISIHALLAESDLFDEDDPDNLWSISIHALLAESDWQAAKALDRLRISPRSPCGERRRRFAAWTGCLRISIHALLAESDDNTV